MTPTRNSPTTRNGNPEMDRRTYGQFCGVARAMEIVGERWGMLIVRDLILGPKRFTDLQATLHKVPSSILAARLNELEEAGVIRRRVLPHLDASLVYELTEYGSDLEEIVLRIGLWGARSLGVPTPDDVFTLDSAILSLYTTFRSDRAEGVRAGFQLHYPPDMVVHAIVEDGTLKVSEGAYPDADLVIHVRGPILPVLTGEMTPHEAVECGLIEPVGDVSLLDLFQDLFHVPPAPQRVEGLAVH